VFREYKESALREKPADISHVLAFVSGGMENMLGAET
jgi:hypothetical protein